MRPLVAIVGAAVIAGSLGTGAVTAYAASDPSPSPTKSAASPAPPADPEVPGHWHRHRMGTMLHGEAVSKDEDGKIRTHAWQSGQVTAASASSVTVRSSDGTAWTWTLNKDTRVRKDGEKGSVSDIAVGDNVMIGGTRDGGTRTAAHVSDPPPDFGKMRERMKDMRERMKGMHKDLPLPPG